MDLVVVPCWWDGTLECLTASIAFQRPDLFHSSLCPISLSPPPNFFPSADIPGVGNLMLASFPPTSLFSSAISHNEWWIGEKYDGVRFCWIPDLGKLTGLELEMLPTIIDSLPVFQFVDGELWAGRGNYSNLFNLVSGSASLVEWHWLRIMAFDDPKLNARSNSFELRYTSLLQTISDDHPLLFVVSRFSGANIAQVLSRAITQLAEGIVLRKTNSEYKPGRSSLLYKMKSMQEDQEGMVTHISPDHVQLKLTNGTKLLVPNQDVQVEGVKIGDIVTFTYNIDVRKALPISPKIFRIRTDVLWNHISVGEKSYSTQPLRHWSLKNMKTFLESIARKKGLNPLVADTWYKIPSSEIRKTKEGRAYLKKYKGGYLYVLKKVFPSLNFDESRFTIIERIKQEGYTAQPCQVWTVKEMREYLEIFAKNKKLNPHSAVSWQKISKSDLRTTTEGRSILKKFNGEYLNMLVKLFPDVNFDARDFPVSMRIVDNRRKVFEEIARRRGLDPLVADTWHKLSSAEIKRNKDVRAIIKKYKGGYSMVVRELFPDVVFPNNTKDEWYEIENKRKFFEEFARSRRLDPLVPDTWYNLSHSDIRNSTEGRTILKRYKGGYFEILEKVFPELNIVAQKKQ